MTQRDELSWINSAINLFDITTGTPHYINDVSISSVKWLKGNPRDGVRAIATLNEILTSFSGGSIDGSTLLGLKENGHTFEITHKKIGSRADYNSLDVIARFDNCEIIGKQVDDPVIMEPGLTHILNVQVQMLVDFRLVAQ